jgi:hypothetical protein
VFILFGPDRTPAEAPSAPAEGASAGADGFGPDALLALLLDEVAAHTAGRDGRALRHAMLDYWETLKEVFALVISDRGDGDRALVAQCIWKRRLLRTFLLRVRSHPRAATSAAPPAAV